MLREVSKVRCKCLSSNRLLTSSINQRHSLHTSRINLNHRLHTSPINRGHSKLGSSISHTNISSSSNSSNSSSSNNNGRLLQLLILCMSNRSSNSSSNNRLLILAINTLLRMQPSHQSIHSIHKRKIRTSKIRAGMETRTAIHLFDFFYFIKKILI